MSDDADATPTTRATRWLRLLILPAVSPWNDSALRGAESFHTVTADGMKLLLGIVASALTIARLLGAL